MVHLFPALEARQLHDDPRTEVQQSRHDDKSKNEETAQEGAESEIAKVNHTHATELERVKQAHQAELEQLKADHKGELEREMKACLERAEVARKQAEDNLAQAKGIYHGQVKASEEKHAAELKSSEEKHAAKEAKLKYKRLYLAKLAELNKLKDGCEKLKDGYEKLKAGYDKLKHDYDSRETTVNACLRENQKRDIEVENLKKDNEDQVKELKVKLEEALTRSVHDMYPDMVPSMGVGKRQVPTPAIMPTIEQASRDFAPGNPKNWVDDSEPRKAAQKADDLIKEVRGGQ